METVGHRNDIVSDSENSFVNNLFYPILDCLMAELDTRFSAEANAIMIGCQALCSTRAFLQLGRLEAFARIFSGNVDDLSHECHQLKRLIARVLNDVQNLNSLQSLAKFLDPYKLAFHELYRLTTIASMLPVCSAACGCSFSALKLTKYCC